MIFNKLTSKKIFFSLLFLVIMVLLMIGLLKSFYNSPLCHDSKVSFYLQGSFGVFNSNEDKVYFMLNPSYYRFAVGICAFPDGGAIILHNSIGLYEFNLETKEAVLLSEIEEKNLGNFMIPSGSHIFGIEYWDKNKNKFYVSIAGQDKKTLHSKRIYLEANVVDGKLNQIKEDEYKKSIINAVRKRGSFDFGSRGQYVDLEINVEHRPKYYWTYVMHEKNNVSKTLIENFDWLPHHYLLENN